MAELSLKLAVDPSEAVSGVEDVGDALKDTSKGFDDLADASQDAGDAIERNVGDSADGVADVGDAARVSQSDFEGLGQAAQQALEGDVSGAAESAVQSVAGIAAAFPGVGIAVGAVAAIIGGVLVDAINKANERQEALKQATQDWATSYIENGNTVLSASAQIAAAQDIYNNRLDEAKTNSTNWGVSLETAVAAMSGSQTAIDQVSDSLDRQFGSMTAAEQAVGGMSNELRDGYQAFNDLNDAMTDGAAVADSWSYYLRDVAASTSGATTEVDEFGDSITTLPDGVQIYVDAETGQATTDTDAIKAKLYSVPASVTSTVKVNVDSTNWDNWTPRQKTSFVSANPAAAAAMGGRQAITG